MTLSLLLLVCLVSLSATAFQCQIKSQIKGRLDHQFHTSTLFASNEYGTDSGGIQQILKKFGFAGRLVTLHHGDLSERPLPAELYDKGTWKLCLVKGLKLPSSSNADDAKPPLLQVLIMDADGLFAENKVVDIGSITFLWSDFYKSFQISTTDELVKTLESQFKEAIKSLQSNILTTEDAMQNLYNGRLANRSRPPTNRHHQALTKKQIPKIAAKYPQFNHLEELLRNLVKVGEDRSSRMVDSALAMDYLYTDFCREGDDEQLIRRVIAATVLTEDATSGGRFKRRSCQFVECSSILEDGVCESATFVNGGWIAQDPSVRAGTEGRKFAATTKQPKDVANSSPVMTAADERIAHRMECLAMGDVWKNDRSNNDDEENSLELDVREALSSMNLPLTADGATRALIQLGRWSQNDVENKNKKAKVIEPWSAEVIDAAQELVSYRQKRQVEIASARKKNKEGKPYIVDGRVDLSTLPCVCVDAKRATFRDDSIGIRLRSSTGRKVTPASKWEVLIHIADVSNIYFDDNESQFKTLRQAAERRGQSRYDLPFGPLHLLPPKALSALALSTDGDSYNECVTVWAYIDERDGKLIEAGLERTIIGSPTALSFDDATNLLESDSQSVPESLTNTRAIITIAERNLSLWSQRRQERSEAAQKREKRLATKELISKELRAAGNVARDDGVGGSFQRSRGHRLVDSSLDLYAVAIADLMKQKKKPVPRAAGSGADRGGRLSTAPLRRYIDGMCQRQAVAVLCGHGKPLSLEECKEASKLASRASDTVANLRSTKKRDGSTNNKQRGALHKVARHISSTGARKLKAVSSGHNNEVVILGTGAVARCRGVKGTLKGGEKLLIEVITIDPERGLLDVRLTS